MRTMLIILVLLCVACESAPPVAPRTVLGDTVIVHTLPGTWTMTLPDGSRGCSASGQPRTFTEAQFLAICRMMSP